MGFSGRREAQEPELKREKRGLRTTIWELSIASFSLLMLLGISCCAPKQVYIPVADVAALENQRTKDRGADGAQPVAVEARREGHNGQGVITEEDISGGAGRGPAAEAGLHSTAPIREIYFDFDSYTLRNADLATLKEFSVWLSAHGRVSVTIEGHCDERGSIEYNLALGQKRAEAVREYLITLGVEEGRIKTISYGKEIPVVTEHTEDAWARNRRAYMRLE